MQIGFADSMRQEAPVCDAAASARQVAAHSRWTHLFSPPARTAREARGGRADANREVADQKAKPQGLTRVSCPRPSPAWSAVRPFRVRPLLARTSLGTTGDAAIFTNWVFKYL